MKDDDVLKVRLREVDLFIMMPGRERRKLLLATARRWQEIGHIGMAVNCKYCLQTSDPDIKKLLKSGKLVQVRTGGSRKASSKSAKRQTYLIPGK